MTRKQKVKYLTEAGTTIRYRFRDCDNRIIVEAVYDEHGWHRFNSTSADQAEAGKLIDYLYEETFFGGNSN